MTRALVYTLRKLMPASKIGTKGENICQWFAAIVVSPAKTVYVCLLEVTTVLVHYGMVIIHVFVIKGAKRNRS